MIDREAALRALYPPVTEGARRQQLAALDAHGRRFVALSPFVVVASGGAHGRLDASPRGGAPGFAHVADERTRLIPDAPGNRRLDTLANLVGQGRIGLLFLIPGIDETLRVNGAACVTLSPERLAPLAALKRRCAHAMPRTSERPQGRDVPGPPPAGVEQGGKATFA